MTVLKKILIGLVVTFVLFFFMTGFIFTPEFLKPIIQEKMETLTGYQLRLDGNLSWHYFPHFGVNAERLSLELPKKSILTLENITLGLEFLPLLHKEFKPTHVSIDQASYQFPHGGMIKFNHIYMTLHTFTAELYQGSVNIEGSVNFQPSLQFDINSTVSNTALAPLLQDLTGKPYASGTLSGNSHLTGQSLATLSGDANATIAQGELQFPHLNAITRQAMLLIGQPLSQKNAISLFDQITAKATINQGIANITGDLSAKNYRAHGTGSTNLNDLSIDMMIDAYYQQNNTAIPIRIRGPIANPKVDVQLSKVLGNDLSTLADHLQQLFHS